VKARSNLFQNPTPWDGARSPVAVIEIRPHHLTTVMPISIKHESLGLIDGNIVDGTAQFLGLKYASLKDCLAPAELISSYSSEPTDATKYGYVSKP
jgi:hypothetical protein